MVDGDRGESRRSAVAVDVKMRDVIAFIASARSTAVWILLLLFVVPPRAYAATPQ